ncbi:HDIG domain-containing protein [Geosporobacter subterraneus DSM 17957]|uniref:HDIG domain-containing protein n=1 Tax=Geosporobacter subterraneus DSM 17957 TaxID=1121919 RepID=A0A1M6KKP8_9FIRM|nr:HD-GYP domain-containing protein [Geosporobacter subterraneus]SHJ59523.1 HDIG domain-containing protein [Geosporobacter subterraneus DSM 17957]
MLHSGCDFADYSLYPNILTAMMEDIKQEVIGHSSRMSHMMENWGHYMNFGNEDIKDLVLAAKYHDIGKFAIPREVLFKPDRLNDSDWQIIRNHSSIGYYIASNTKMLNKVAKVILHHHERWDGKGYPAQLKAEEIPQGARMIAILDAYDAMVSERSYKKAISSYEALQEIKKCSGTQFDPNLVEQFIMILEGNKECAV